MWDFFLERETRAQQRLLESDEHEVRPQPTPPCFLYRFVIIFLFLYNKNLFPFLWVKDCSVILLRGEFIFCRGKKWNLKIASYISTKHENTTHITN